MAQIYSRVYAKESKFSRREQLVILEIGSDSIDTASSFVDYMKENYGFSKSSTWYCLNRLKASATVEFANRDEIGKPLSLTKRGLEEFTKLESTRNEVISYFSSSYLNGASIAGLANSYGSGLRNKSYALYR